MDPKSVEKLEGKIDADAHVWQAANRMVVA